MWKLSRAALLCASVILLMQPEGISLSGATAQEISSPAQQSLNKNKRKTKPRARKKILKGRHERHRRRPA